MTRFCYKQFSRPRELEPKKIKIGDFAESKLLNTFVTNKYKYGSLFSLSYDTHDDFKTRYS